MVRYPGPGVVIAFYQYPIDTTPIWSLSYAGPWAPLRMLYKCEAYRLNEDPTKWNLWLQPATRTDIRGRGLWLQLEFERALPEDFCKDWPDYDAR